MKLRDYHLESALEVLDEVFGRLTWIEINNPQNGQRSLQADMVRISLTPQKMERLATVAQSFTVSPGQRFQSFTVHIVFLRGGEIRPPYWLPAPKEDGK